LLENAQKLAELESGGSSSKSRGINSPANIRASDGASTAHIHSSLGSEANCKLSKYYLPNAIVLRVGFVFIVCVLDGREREFNFNSDIFVLASKLPRFSSEIPFGSVVMLGYAVSMWGDDNISFSINWAIVLATPTSHSQHIA
jgi:hypothetical protein